MPDPRSRSPRPRDRDMRITVKYMAQLKRAAGIDAEQIEVAAGFTIEKLITTLAQRSTIRKLLVDDDSRPQRALLVFNGDEQLSSDSARMLNDGDHITLLTPMAG